MSRFRSSHALILLCLGLASLACPESRTHRSQRILGRVSRMHREIFETHRGASLAFARQEAGHLPLTEQGWCFIGWPKCPLADTDGERISRDLLKAFMDLKTRSDAGDPGEAARDYAVQRIRFSRTALGSLAAPGDRSTLDGRIREATREVYRRDLDAETRCLADLGGTVSP